MTTENQLLREALQGMLDAYTNPEAGEVDQRLAVADARKALSQPTAASPADMDIYQSIADGYFKDTAASGEVVGLERIYETIIRWDEGGGKRSRRELARRIVALYTNPPARQPQAGTVSRAMLEASRVAKGQSAFFEQMMERSMSKKLTHWFDGRTQKPWESGVYQQRSASGLLGYQYWDGQYWYGWGESVEGAMSMYKPSNKVHPSFMNDDWRGLAHPPKNIGNAMQARQQAGGA